MDTVKKGHNWTKVDKSRENVDLFRTTGLSLGLSRPSSPTRESHLDREVTCIINIVNASVSIISVRIGISITSFKPAVRPEGSLAICGWKWSAGSG